MKILVAECDLTLATLILKGLAAENYAVDVARNTGEAERLVAERLYDLMILDLNLPPAECGELIGRAREKRSTLAILLLSEVLPADEAENSSCAADDCLAKPFSFTELSARVRAVIRRRKPQLQSRLRVADLEIHSANRSAKRGKRRIALTPREFSLLEYLMLNTGQALTREMIIKNVWKLHLETLTNVVDVYVNYLRKKIDAGSELKLIRTIRGVGYLFGSEKAHGS